MKESLYKLRHNWLTFPQQQAIYNQMIKEANEYHGDYKKTYLDAASRFKLPYWDISMPRNSDDSKATPKAKQRDAWRWGLPEILKRPKVYVRTYDAPEELQERDNPLYSFSFPKKLEFKDVKNRPQIPWESTFLWNELDRKDNGLKFAHSASDHSIRAPALNTTKSEVDTDDAYLEEKVQLQTRDLTRYVWQMLNPEEELETGESIKINQLRSWNYFANNTSPARSIESWRDNIHNLISTGNGFTGHMGDPAVAAFDPLFWLHHNNIERLFCLYQVLYPDKYVSPGKRNHQDKNPNILADDELFPFTKDSNTKKCYTSTDVKDWTKSGFAVPGDQDLGETGQKAVAQYLRDTYYWSVQAD